MKRTITTLSLALVPVLIAAQTVILSGIVKDNNGTIELTINVP